MNRRQFIKYSGMSLALAGGFSLFHSFGQLKAPARENPPDQITKLDDDGAALVYLAALAPSGHNAQPWTVRVISAHHWIIGTVPSRWLPVVDPDNLEALISIGAFLENLIMAANTKGYELEVKLMAQSAKNSDLLDIQLHKTNPAKPFDIQTIILRRSVRTGLLTNDLSKDDIHFLQNTDTNHFTFFPRQSREGNYLAEGTLLANKTQTYSDQAQEELANWIRWSNQEIKQYRNGLTAETMEIQGIARWFVKNFYHRQSTLANSFREQTIKKVQEQLSACSGWLLITSKNSSIPELINTGRNLQRLWLSVRDKKIALHPMTQLIEETAIRNELASILGIKDELQLLLRVGYIKDYPQPVSPRMPLTNIIS